MFTEQDLFVRLHATEIDSGELELIAMSYFHGGSSPSPNEVVFSNSADLGEVALRLLYKNGRL
jgi:hypothetical protein